MFKYIITALTALLFVLLSSGSFAPAKATTNDPQVYIWDYVALGSSQVVCKQVIFHPVSRPLPKGSQVQPTNISSKVVDEGNCSHLTPPKI